MAQFSGTVAVALMSAQWQIRARGLTRIHEARMGALD
jgi:hypothetical protein